MLLLRNQTPSGSRLAGRFHLFFGIFLLALAVPPAWGQEDDSPAANRLASEAANLQNEGKFAIAADVWDDFLKRFPDSGLAPKARYYSGVCHMKVGQLNEAIDAFTQVVEQIKDNADFPYNQDALLNLGGCYLSRADLDPEIGQEDYQRAAKTFEQLAKDYADGKYRDQAVYFRAEALYLGGNVKDSIPLYTRLVDEFPDSSVRPNGLYALGVALDEAGERPSALLRYEAFLKDFPDNSLVPDVSMRRAEVLLQQAQESGAAEPETWEPARQAFAKLAQLDGFTQADRATYQQAFCEAKQGSTEAAAKLYDQLVEQFPQSPYRIDALISAGRTRYQLKQYPQAIATLQQVIDARSERSGEAGHWLAQSLLGQGNPQQAFDLTGQWIAAQSDDPYLPYLIMDRADAAFALADHKSEARSLYLKVAEDYPDHPLAPQALYNAAFEDFEAQRADDALLLADRFLESYPGDGFAADVRALKAECHLQLGHAAEAESTYVQLLADVPRHVDRERWPLRLALCQYTQKRYQPTLETLQAIDSWSQAEWAAEASYLKGASHYYLEDYQAAVTDLSEATEQRAAWNQVDIALVLLGRSYARLEQWDRARATLESLLTEFPNSSQLPEAWFRLGEIEEGAGRVSEAQKWYQQVLSKAPEHPLEPYAQVADSWLSFDARQWDAAAQGFESFLTQHKNHPLATESRLGLGMAQRQAGQFDLAIKTLSAFLEGNNDQESQLNARFELGMALMGQEQYSEAAEQLGAILTANAQWSRADQVLYQLAWSGKYQEQNSIANDYFKQLTDRFPKSSLAAEAWFHQGEAAYEAEQYDPAEKLYAQAIEASTAGTIRDNAAYKQAWSQFKLNEHNAARERFDTLSQTASEPLKSQAQFMVAECRFEAKEYDQALPVYQAVLPRLEESEQISDVMKQLAWLHASQTANQLKQSQVALDLAEQFLAKYPQSPSVGEAWFEVGAARNALKSPDTAIEAYEEAALVGAPAIAARARFMIGEVHFAAERFDEAVRQFNRVMFGFGDEAPASVAQWQAVAGFEAGRCFHVQIAKAEGDAQKKLIEQAIEAYQYVVSQHAQNRLSGEAAKQIEKLKAFKPQ